MTQAPCTTLAISGDKTSDKIKVDALTSYIAAFYEKLDTQLRKLMVLLSADLVPRVSNTAAKQRLTALEILLKDHFSHASPSDITKNS